MAGRSPAASPPEGVSAEAAHGDAGTAGVAEDGAPDARRAVGIMGTFSIATTTVAPGRDAPDALCATAVSAVAVIGFRSTGSGGARAAHALVDGSTTGMGSLTIRFSTAVITGATGAMATPTVGDAQGPSTGVGGRPRAIRPIRNA